MLSFDLQLKERLPDRVVVGVLLKPTGASAQVDGVAVALRGPDGERLSNRLMLPIAGTLTQPMLTAIELRACTALVPGARIVGIAWHDGEQWETSIPADPGTCLEAHCRGWHAVKPIEDEALRFKRPRLHELAALQEAFPWLTPSEAPLAIVETEEEVDVRRACEDLGLDEEDAEWLEELLAEP